MCISVCGREHLCFHASEDDPGPFVGWAISSGLAVPSVLLSVQPAGVSPRLLWTPRAALCLGGLWE